MTQPLSDGHLKVLRACCNDPSIAVITKDRVIELLDEVARLRAENGLLRIAPNAFCGPYTKALEAELKDKTEVLELIRDRSRACYCNTNRPICVKCKAEDCIKRWSEK